MQFDDVFYYVGHYEFYQKLLCFAIATTTLINAFQQVGINILAHTPDHWCKVDRLGNFTHDQQKEIAIPYNEEDQEFEQCKMYDVNWWLYTDEQLLNNTETIKQNASIVHCHEWTFDQTEFSTTAVTEWQLVCQREWYLPTASSVFVFGFLCGALMVGPVSDIFGKKRSLFLFMVLLGLTLASSAFSPNMIVFVSLRTLSAAFTWACHGLAFTLSMELIGPGYRTFVGNQYYVSYCLSVLLFVGVSYLVRGFRTLTMIYSGVCFSLTALWFVIPESPRFLYAKGKYDEANEILETIAKRNGRSLPNHVNVHSIGKTEEKLAEHEKGMRDTVTLTTVMKSPILRANMIYVIITVTMVRLVNQTTVFAVSTLPGDVYFNMTVLAVSDIPAAISTIYMMRKFGKISTIVITSVGAATLLGLATPFFSMPGYEQVASIIVLMGRACTTGAGNVVVIMQEELHPTPVRQKIVGLENGISLAITVAGPYITELAYIWDALPSLIYAFFSICIALSSMKLPDTEGKKMPDTISEAEQLGRGKLFPWCRSSESHTLDKKSVNAEYDNYSFTVEGSELNQIKVTVKAQEHQTEGTGSNPS